MKKKPGKSILKTFQKNKIQVKQVFTNCSNGLLILKFLFKKSLLKTNLSFQLNFTSEILTGWIEKEQKD